MHIKLNKQNKNYPTRKVPSAKPQGPVDEADFPFPVTPLRGKNIHQSRRQESQRDLEVCEASRA